MRRSAALGSTALAALLLLTSCNSSAGSSDAAVDGKVTTTVDLFGTFGFKESGLYEEYTKLHPDITVKQTDTQDEGQYWQALQTKLAGGGGLADIQGREVGRVASVLQKQADKFTDLKTLGLGAVNDELAPWRAPP